jgi:exodeoxyribonuclease V alpha subunit
MSGQGSLFDGFDGFDGFDDHDEDEGAAAPVSEAVPPTEPAEAEAPAAPSRSSVEAGPEGGGDAAAVLAPWREAGVLSPSDVHIALTLARLAGLDAGDPVEAQVVLGVALAARAPRQGHVCLDLTSVRQSVPAEVEGDADTVAAAAIDALPWPDDLEAWRAALAGCAELVAVAVDGEVPPAPAGQALPLVLDGTRLYLERYRVYEDRVAAELLRRAAVSATTADGTSAPAAPTVAASAFAGAFEASPEQQLAAEAGAAGLLSVLVGGPGTGKTTTVATLLALLLEADPSTRIALVAPTGKAAARLGESIGQLASRLRESGIAGAGELADRLAEAEATTIHRRLGVWPGRTFRHGRDEPLVHDVVIVDETSMVSLPLMAHLLDAVRPDARVVLVGDPGQLASVEAGSVLGDIAGPAVDAALEGRAAPEGPLAGCVAVLSRSYRFPEGSPVGRFAAAVRAGDADAALAVLDAGAGAGAGDAGAGGADDGSVRLGWAPEGADTEAGAAAVRAAALGAAEAALDAAVAGDARRALEELGRVRVLCAHRRGPFGVAWWNWQFEGWLGDGPGGRGSRLSGTYVGRPVMVTANDALNAVSNGDLGIVVQSDDGPRLALPDGGGDVRLLLPARLEAVDTVHAMTIHKSQGSEFDEIVVVLPPAESRLATRELLYTAVTRARKVVTLVGGAEALRRAVTNRVVRQTGLRDRLWSQ